MSWCRTPPGTQRVTSGGVPGQIPVNDRSTRDRGPEDPRDTRVLDSLTLEVRFKTTLGRFLRILIHLTYKNGNNRVIDKK